ncbi:MAG TPA: flagellar basal body rod protein FlgB [Anaerolineaceae bacterium]
MAISMIDDSAMQAARIALDGLSQRQQVISHNLANVDTPGYKAQMVSFEGALSRAISQNKSSIQMQTTSEGHITGSGAGSMSVQVTERPGGSTRADGNNVDIDTELIDQTETGLRYQAISQVLSKKLILLKAIATAR